MLSRGSGADDARRRAHEERTRRENAEMPDVEKAAPPASAAEARAAREARAAGAAPTKRSARDAAAVRAARAERRPARRRRWTKGKVAALVLTLLALALAATVVASFSWLRWFAHDDAADIQGTWYLAGTSTPIVIDEERIQLTDDVAYHYTLDSGAKTIEFTFGSLTGGGCYRFSLDRDELALVDGAFSGTDTLARDIGWILEALIEKAQGRSLAPAEEAGRGLTLLSRTPTAGASANPQSVRDTPASEDAAAGDGTDADGSAAAGGDDGDAQTIQDEPVGDLSGKIPADINDARDKAADDAAAGAAAAGDGAASGSSGSAQGAGAASGSGSGSGTASAPSAADVSSAGSGA